MEDLRRQGITNAVVMMVLIGYLNYRDAAGQEVLPWELAGQIGVVLAVGALGYGWGTRSRQLVFGAALLAALLAVGGQVGGSSLVFLNALPIAVLSVLVGGWLSLKQRRESETG